MMPNSVAMATAVSLWSPVIIIGRMPAERHSAIASLTSGRTGSIMPTKPTNTKSCSSASGLWSAGTASSVLKLHASTRNARSAYALFCCKIAARSDSVKSAGAPFLRIFVQFLSTSSGAPLVNCNTPSAVLCTVDIILRIESNGASPTRGASFNRSFLLRFNESAYATSAASVGSPTKLPSLSILTSVQSAIPFASRVSSSP